MNFLIAVFVLASAVRPDIQHLKPAELRALLDKGEAVAVDVRGSVPYELGHVAGAVWMPLGLIGQRAGELPDDKLIVTYCTCKAEESSLEAARVLSTLGFARVGVLVGGYPAWSAAGLPTESNRPPAAVPAGTAGSGRGRLAPPAAVSCPREELTSFAGSATSYTREAGRTVVVLRTSAETVETVVIRHPGTDDPSRFFLFEGSPFLGQHWRRVEAAKGRLLPGMGVVAWVCKDGTSWLDWRPGAKFQGAE